MGLDHALGQERVSAYLPTLGYPLEVALAVLAMLAVLLRYCS